MKFSTLSVLLSCSSAVIADFDLYSGSYDLGFNSPSMGYNAVGLGGEAGQIDMDVWQIFDADPDCADVRDTALYQSSDDVSGDKTGVRCVDNGHGCMGDDDPIGIQVLEMHFSNNPLYHWTIYQNRGNYDLIGLDDNVYGHCVLFPANDYTCLYGSLWNFGHRKFRCYTEFTAAQINAAA